MRRKDEKAHSTTLVSPSDVWVRIGAYRCITDSPSPTRSWHSIRIRQEEEVKKHGLTVHHVPPKSHGARFTLRKSLEDHTAYHRIFSNAPSLEACIEILKLYWWTPEERSHDKTRLGKGQGKRNH